MAQPMTTEEKTNARCARVKLLRFPLIPDPRGNLVFAEFPKHLPFEPKRFFVTYGVPVGSVRENMRTRRTSKS